MLLIANIKAHGMMDKSHGSHSTIWRNFDCLRVNTRPADNPEGSLSSYFASLDFPHTSKAFVNSMDFL